MAVASAVRVRNWIGLGVAETVSRILVRLAVTAFLARLLLPEDFGAAAIAISIATLLSLGVGAPYEEALAQHRYVRRRHLEALLGAALLVAITGCLLLIPVGAGMALWFERGDFLVIMIALGLLLLLQAYNCILLGIARRWHRFEAINFASMLGEVIGGVTAAVAGWAGLGIWALIVMPIVTLAVSTVALLVSIGLAVRPRLDFALTAPFWRFGRYILASRLLDSATYLMMNLLVGHLFTLQVLGYFNMAMRIVEPIRGAAGALGNNLGYPFFKAARDDSGRMRAALAATFGRSALLTAPVFMGVASISPVLIPLLAGPEWNPAVPIAMLLALGGMFMIPPRIASAAISAAGRPLHRVSITLAGFGALLIALTLLAKFGPVSIGLARLIADIVQAGVALLIGRAVLGAPLRLLAGSVAIPWGAALSMAAMVLGFGEAAAPILPPWAILIASAGLGVVVYAAILFLFDRERLMALLAAARGRDDTSEPVGPRSD